MPPPTTIIINKPEAASVYLPRPSTEMLKILDHITEVQSPQRTRRRALNGTTTIENDVPVNMGIEVVTVFGMNIANKMSIIPTADTHVIIILLDTLSAMKPARKRPTSIRNQ